MKAFDDAWAVAERKSRYGRRTWVFYHARNGANVAELATAEALKRAMLATGTRMYQDESCFVFQGGTATIGFWWMLNNMRRQALRAEGAV